ncbi:hypothetical protein [Desulfogranum japonicum]|uniref:hypothetical protein n=1 Tax=Desulfogranum japonicum TaxID=231447 RepID=UPI0004194752|nr:hypothetical protein [Desulfogranum japonicum]
MIDITDSREKFASTRIIELDPQPFIETSSKCSGVSKYIGEDRLAILYQDIFDLMQRVDQIEQNPKKYYADCNGDKAQMQAKQAEFMFASNINNLKAWSPSHRPGKIESSGYFDSQKGASASAISLFLNKATDGEQKFVETGIIDLFEVKNHRLQVLKRREIFNVILQLYYRQLALAYYDAAMAHDIVERDTALGRSHDRFIKQRMFSFPVHMFFKTTAVRSALTREQGAILEDRISLLYSIIYQAINKFAAVEREPNCFTYPNDLKNIKKTIETWKYVLKHIDRPRSWTPEWSLNHPETEDFFPGMSVKERYFMDKGIIDRWKTATAGYAVISREEMWRELMSFCFQQVALAQYEYNCSRLRLSPYLPDKRNKKEK